jgi:hypothetical protein
MQTSAKFVTFTGRNLEPLSQTADSFTMADS